MEDIDRRLLGPVPGLEEITNIAERPCARPGVTTPMFGKQLPGVPARAGLDRRMLVEELAGPRPLRGNQALDEAGERG